MALTMQQMIDHLPQVGRLEGIGVRIARDQPMQFVDSAEIRVGQGLVGDRFNGKATSKRQVTLFQLEHFAVLSSLMNKDVSHQLVRRNLVVSGINLWALRDRRFSIGDVLLEGTGICHPCSKMELGIGPGAYNAMRGHCGITARVVAGGVLNLNDSVKLHSGDVEPR